MRLLLAVAVVAVLPGWAILSRLQLDDPLERIVLSVAVSLAVATGVAAVLMYAGWWSPGRAVAAALGVTLAAVSMPPRRPVP